MENNTIEKSNSIEEIGRDTISPENSEIELQMEADEELDDCQDIPAFPYPTLSHSEIPYDDRELSWLKFNYRVLNLVNNPKTPLLEKVKFLSIANSNLDEFFSIRVASRLQEDTDSDIEYSKTSVSNIIKKCNNISAGIDITYNQLILELAQNDIHIHQATPYGNVEEFNQEKIFKYFSHSIKPALAPLIIDSTRPLPHIKPFCIYIACIIGTKDEERIGLIEIPPQLDRMIKFKTGWYFIEDIITSYINQLYPGLTCSDIVSFRLLRDGDTVTYDEESGYIDSMLKHVRNRILFNDPIRLEVHGLNSKKIVNLLRSSLKMKKKLVFRTSARLKMSDIIQIYDAYDKNPEWKYPNFKPANTIIDEEESIMDMMEDEDIIIHHPYESFNNTVLRLIKEAANDPYVISIKQTLYRSGNDSKILKHLLHAAESGKNVVVVLEIKARFDEENNIEWAEKLQKAGATVVYGFEKIKTHAKLIHIFRKKGRDITSYSHIGTGNYSEKNAKIYTDFSYLTTNTKICEDVNDIFNILTGGYISDQINLNKLKIAPLHIRPTLYEMIDGEIAKEKEGYIFIKVNNLSDHDIVNKLYQASNAGVQIDIIARGSCSLIPGIEGYSENITVKSIVGQFLEHSRVFMFGKENKRVFISSSDLMTRNLDRRVEILFEIPNKHIRESVIEVMDMCYNDTFNAYSMESTGLYTKLEGDYNSQEKLIQRYQKLSN